MSEIQKNLSSRFGSSFGARRAFRSMIVYRMLMAVWSAVVCIDAANASNPNVIVILADDQGSLDLGCYGARDLQTPHLDALAARGVRFTQFYAAAPLCSPSRASLLTGRYPLRASVPENVGSQREDKRGLPPGEITLAEMFQAAGYATAHIGKWHLGYSPETMPNQQGFMHSFGHMGGCIDNWSHFFYWGEPNVHDLHRNAVEVYEEGRYFPELMLQEATAFMERERERPFFIYYALNTPHYPYQGETQWLKAFQHLPTPRRLYAAFLASQDERLGKLFAKVDQLGLRDRTVVVFQSDNGHSTEGRAHGGGGSAGPLRGAKFSLLEGGIRVPAIISLPGTVPQNATRDQVAHAVDWLPTLTELCGVPLPNVALDGVSLVPLLHGAQAASPQRVLHWQVGVGSEAAWAVREGDWKLVANTFDTSVVDAKNAKAATRIDRLLVNLRDDPGERTDLAARRPDVVARLQLLHQRQQTMRPEFNPMRWEADILALEAADGPQNMPENKRVVFVGSSSIRMWDLAKGFPEASCVNRGFGGSHMRDAAYYADRLVLRWRPQAVVVYAGDNDIAAGLAPETVADEFQVFANKIRGALPETRIFYLAIKPSEARWELVGAMRRANELIERWIADQNNLVYIDTHSPLLGAEGRPRPEFFLEDRLHLNAQGYQAWETLLRPYLQAL